MAAQPKFREVEYLHLIWPSKPVSRTKTVEATIRVATSWVARVIQFLLLGFHTDSLVADGDGALRKAPGKYGMPEEHLPQIHLCLNHWFRNLKKLLYTLKGKTAKALRLLVR